MPNLTRYPRRVYWDIPPPRLIAKALFFISVFALKTSINQERMANGKQAIYSAG